MNFGLSEEQRILDEAVRGFLKDRAPLELLRETAAGGTGFDPDLWQGLCELGVPGLLIPAEFGGAGLGVLEAALVAEALGYAAVPAPFLAASVMGPLVFLHSGTQRQRSEWLPRIAAGEVRPAVAMTAIAGTTQTADLRAEGGRLSGQVQGLLDAGAATHIIVQLRGGSAALVGREDAGVRLEAQPTLDRTRPLATVTFDGAACEMLQASNDPTGAASRVLAAGRVVLAADTLGAAQCMLDKAVAYARERVQFGRVIGSFQAVKHSCAEMVSMLEPCRALVWYAAHAQDAVPEEARSVACHAKAHLGEVGREVSRLATEVHGGMGFTDLLGLHYWFKRIAFDRQVLGAPERCRQEAAIAQGWVAAS